MNYEYYNQAIEYKYKSEYSEAVECLTKFLITCDSNDKLFKKAFYLKIEMLRFLNKYKEIRLILDNIPFQDASFEYLKSIRKAVNHHEDVPWFTSKIISYKQATNDIENTLFNQAVLMRDLNNHSKAIYFIKKRLEYIVSKNTFTHQKENQVKKQVEWSLLAQEALIDLKKSFEKHNIEFFLKGGLLLGCIRENRILPHDYDGVDDRFNRSAIVSAIKDSSMFCFRENVNDNTIYITHKNGVLADIFIHYMENNLYKNKGMYVTWSNKPFRLIEKYFLNETYLIPEHPEEYLTDTYGNWREPQSDYNTYTDNLNIEVNNKSIMEFYYISKITTTYLKGKTNLTKKLLHAYEKLSLDHELTSNIKNKIH